MVFRRSGNYWLSGAAVAVIAVAGVAIAFPREKAIAFVESPNGPREVKLEAGISKEDLDFLQSFRRPIIDSKVAIPELRSILRDQMTKDFQGERSSIDQRFPHLTESEKFILFLMLRANGSMPVYKTRALPLLTFPDMLTALDGNCYDVSIRLSILLEAVGIKSAIITIFTNALPGHVIVSAYDETWRTAYLLDANTNVFRHWRDVDSDILTILSSASPDDRKKLFEVGEDVDLPIYFRFYAPPPDVAFSPNPVTADYLNEVIPASRKNAWRSTFTDQFAQLVGSWRGTGLVPRTLTETASFFAPQTPTGSQNLSDFSPQLGLDLAKIRTKLGIEAKGTFSEGKFSLGPNQYWIKTPPAHL